MGAEIPPHPRTVTDAPVIEEPEHMDEPSPFPDLPATPPPLPPRVRPQPAAPAPTVAKAHYSAEAERAVLGAMLTHPAQVINKVMEEITAVHFFHPAHQKLFDTLAAMQDRQEPIDIVTVHTTLCQYGLAIELGSPGILAELSGEVASHLNVMSYVSVVKEQWYRRDLQDACLKALMALDQPLKAHQVAEALDARLSPIVLSGSAKKKRTWTQVADDTHTALMAEKNPNKRCVGIESGLRSLDTVTTGWRKGDMIVIAARPGVGKSITGLQFAHHVARKRWDDNLNNFVRPGSPVGVFSLEMSDDQLMERMYSRESEISLKNIRARELTDQEKGLITDANGRVRDLPIILDTDRGITINQLRAKARAMKQRHGIDLLVIDYIGLIASDPNAKGGQYNRQNEMQQFSRSIKNLAGELDLPILVLAQLNRKSEEGNTPPQIHNLRESGAIEQDADAVLLLYIDDKGEFYIIVGKQRSGETPVLRFRLDKSRMTIHDL